MATTGTTTFAPALGDLTLEAFARIQVRPPELTADMMYQARSSANLMLVDFAVSDGPNLWEQKLLSIPLQQGVATYPIPPSVIGITDYYIRQFNIGGVPVNVTPSFSTVSGSTTVTISLALHGYSTGEWISIIVPVAVGGLLLQGFYTVSSIIDLNTFTIAAPVNAAATVSGGGSVPQFTTTSGSSTVTVTLANHGLGPGQTFAAQVATTVGGLVISGSYIVVTVPSLNTFTITVPFVASASTSGSENGGQTQFQSQLVNVDPLDRVIFPISRTEYAAQPDKQQQAFPTVVFFLRTINPTVTLWPVPDGNGPYVLYAWTISQIQDAAIAGGVGLDIPYRFYDAFAAGLAARLARKFSPQLAGELRMEAEAAWEKAAKQDTELNVPLFIFPGLTGYYG